jgi:phosphoribosylanthranilate isomerase
VTKIKICGITTTDDGLYAAQQGVDFVGFIFYPPSPRYVSPVQASAIVRVIRSEMGIHSSKFVGVFVNTQLDDIKYIRNQVGLDLIQLHGDEPLKTIQDLLPGVYKALRPKSREDLIELVEKYSVAVTKQVQTPHFLLDSFHPEKKGGTGQLTDLEFAVSLAQHYRLLLAGGLQPENVASIIQTVNPWGVDVSSGVEMERNGKLVKGRKDYRKIKAFVDAVRNADSVNNHQTTQ